MTPKLEKNKIIHDQHGSVYRLRLFVKMVESGHFDKVTQKEKVFAQLRNALDVIEKNFQKL